MKRLIKLLTFLSVSLLCTSCDDVFDGIMFNSQSPTYGVYYYFPSYALIKGSINLSDNNYSIDKESVTINSVSNYSVVRKTNNFLIDGNSVSISFSLFDEIGRYKKPTNETYYKPLFFSGDSLVTFLKQYDYFYLFCGAITDNNHSEYINVKTKLYNLFPFKGETLKLTELQDFYADECELPYSYLKINMYNKDGKCDDIPFTDFYWNNMSSIEFENSFNRMADNPPDPSIERLMD